MTKKNASKRAARERQERFGGKYLDHLNHVLAKPGASPAQSHTPTGGRQVAVAATIEQLLLYAEQEAPGALSSVGETASETILVIVDAADPVGERLVARRRVIEKDIPFSRALGEVRSEVLGRTSQSEYALYLEMMTWTTLRGELDAALPSDRHVEISNLEQRLVHRPEPERVNVLAVGGGELRATTVPAGETCLCGHPLAQHDATGRCTWVGIPGGGPFLGASKEMVQQARARGIPFACPCAGQPSIESKSGERVPLGPAVLSWPE